MLGENTFITRKLSKLKVWSLKTWVCAGTESNERLILGNVAHVFVVPEPYQALKVWIFRSMWFQFPQLVFCYQFFNLTKVQYKLLKGITDNAKPWSKNSGFQIWLWVRVVFVFSSTIWLITFTWHTRCKSLPGYIVRTESSMFAWAQEQQHGVPPGAAFVAVLWMPLAQLPCFNRNMSTLLPGKLWMQFWPLRLLSCLFLGVPPIKYCPKCLQNGLTVMQPRKTIQRWKT